MDHPRLTELEEKMTALCARVDVILEESFGPLYHLHPARPLHGQTASPEQSGLFDVGTSFTAGFGSRYGKGYILEVDMRTLQEVEPADRARIETEAIRRVNELLPEYFPERKLELVKDGGVLKIIGDFSLGTL